MKTRRQTTDLLIAVVFCLFLGVIAVLFLLLPKNDFSPDEKRYLADAPELTVKTLVNGEFGEQAESWATDHIPGRKKLVQLAAEMERALGLQPTKEILPGKSGRLYESPYAFSEKTIEKNMLAVNAFAEKTGKTVDVVLVPSAGYLMEEDISCRHDAYRDDEIIACAASLAGEHVVFHDLLRLFAAEKSPETLYYATDHHWTSLGAYRAYSSLMEEKGRSHPTEEEYEITPVSGFSGTLYSRSCFWDVPPETLELWSSGGEYLAEFSEKNEKSNALFFTERLDEADKYPVYLDGNHPLAKITNLSGNAEGKLLVIRDSYANCLGCFLADSYESVTLADLRYYKEPLSRLCAEEDFDEILFIYSVGNFMTDSNIIWLE